MSRSHQMQMAWHRQLQACKQSDQLLQAAVESSQGKTNHNSLTPSTEGQSGRSPSSKIPPMGEEKTLKIDWIQHIPLNNPGGVVSLTWPLEVGPR